MKNIFNRRIFFFALCFLFAILSSVRTYYYITPYLLMNILSISPYLIFIVLSLFRKKPIDFEMSGGVFFYFLIDVGFRLNVFLNPPQVLVIVLDLLVPLFCFPIYLLGKKVYFLIYAGITK